MENRQPTKYKFNQIEKGLVAFIANLELRINEIYPDIPVFVVDTGNETYFMRDKFENAKELYQQVPRVTINISEIEFQTDQDTNQYVKFLYKFLNKIFKAQFRRKATNIPIVVNFVCSNFIKALEYLEVLSCILSIDNAFTYEHLGNNQQGSFNLTSFSLEKNGMDPGGTKNYIIKANVDLQLQLFLIKYRTIIDVTNDGSGLEPVFNIKDKNGDQDYETLLKPFDPEIKD